MQIFIVLLSADNKADWIWIFVPSGLKFEKCLLCQIWGFQIIEKGI